MKRAGFRHGRFKQLESGCVLAEGNSGPKFDEALLVGGWAENYIRLMKCKIKVIKPPRLGKGIMHVTYPYIHIYMYIHSTYIDRYIHTNHLHANRCVYQRGPHSGRSQSPQNLRPTSRSCPSTLQHRLATAHWGVPHGKGGSVRLHGWKRYGIVDWMFVVTGVVLVLERPLSVEWFFSSTWVTGREKLPAAPCSRTYPQQGQRNEPSKTGSTAHFWWFERFNCWVPTPNPSQSDRVSVGNGTSDGVAFGDGWGHVPQKATAAEQWSFGGLVCGY